MLGVIKRPSDDNTSGIDLNDIRGFGFYNITGNETNSPFVGVPSNRGIMFCSGLTSSNKYVQVIVNADSIFVREDATGTWGHWYKMTGTLVTV